MLVAIKNKIYNTIFSKHLKVMFAFFAIVFLSGCSKETSDVTIDNNCWQASIADATVVAINSLYSQGKAAINGTIVMAGFAVWLGIKMLNVLGSFKEENLGEVLSEIGSKLVLCSTVAYFCSGAMNEAFDLTVIPIYNTLLELGASLIENIRTGAINIGVYGSVSYSGGAGENCGAASISAGDLRTAIMGNGKCLICRINFGLQTGVEIGIQMVATAEISAILVGIFLVFTFTVAKFGFALFIVDCLFRINYAAFILPIFVAGVPFSMTKGFCVKGIRLFVSSSCIMMVMGLLLSVALSALISLFGQLNGSITAEAMEGTSTIYMTMLILSILFYSIPGLAVNISNQLTGVSCGSEFAQKVSQFAMNLAKKAAIAAASYFTGGAAGAISKVSEKHEVTRAAADDVAEKAKAVSDALGGGANDD